MVTKLSSRKKVSSNVNDPVADLLTRIRNANLAYKDELVAPVSKLADSVLKILDTEGYIGGFSKEGEGVNQAFRIRLKYGVRRRRTITGLRADLDARATGLPRPGRAPEGSGRARHRDHLDVATA